MGVIILNFVHQSDTSVFQKGHRREDTDDDSNDTHVDHDHDHDNDNGDNNDKNDANSQG